MIPLSPNFHASNAYDDNVRNNSLCRTSNRRVIVNLQDPELSKKSPFDFETIHIAYKNTIVLHGLTSEVGKLLNGQLGIVYGMDGLLTYHCSILGSDRAYGIHKDIDESSFRVHVGLKNDPTGKRIVKVKYGNIRFPSIRVPLDTPVLTDKEVREIVSWLVNEGPYSYNKIGHWPATSRDDIGKRILLINSLAQEENISNFNISCCDVSVNNSIDLSNDPFLTFFNKLTTNSSCFGCGQVDLHRMNIGLVANGDRDCVICLEVMIRGSLVSLLPCGHQFHHECYESYDLKGGLVCPICRTNISGSIIEGNSFIHYSISPIERIRNRFAEFIQSGMCAECQLINIEEAQFGEVEIDTVEGPMKMFYSESTGFLPMGEKI